MSGTGETKIPQRRHATKAGMALRFFSLLRRHPLYTILVLLLAVYGIWWLVLVLNRPMFSNELTSRRRTLVVQRWLPTSLNADEYGNAAITDHRLNILAVFFVHYNSDDPNGLDLARFVIPHRVADGVIFPDDQGRDDIDFHVPKRENTLFVFEADGSRRDYPLAPGEAKRIHDLLVFPPGGSCYREMLRKAYAEKHSIELTYPDRQPLTTGMTGSCLSSRCPPKKAK